jgi:hypothetical protein
MGFFGVLHCVQDDGKKLATAKADPYGMTNKRTSNSNGRCNSNGG